MTKEETIKNCTVDGNIIKLPEGQLDRPVYNQVKKALEGIGGKWKTNKQGFVFASDPSDLLAEIQGGKKINLKKDFQFFATSPEEADRCVELAGIKDLSPYARICEPSAGQGAIVNAINRVRPDKVVYCYELMPQNQPILTELETVIFMGEDFLLEDKEQYDCIIANPPFSKNQDIDHVKHMYDRLNDGGRLVSITSTHWVDSSNKKETAFREWLDEVGAQIHTIEAGAFKASGTQVGGKIIVINK